MSEEWREPDEILDLLEEEVDATGAAVVKAATALEECIAVCREPLVGGE